jgi:predicted deacylase
MAEKFVFGEQVIAPGSRQTISVPLPDLYISAPMSLQAHVIRGRREGPKLFLCGAIHGDELNGIEIIRRLLERPALRRMRGTLIALPMVNVYGVLNQSRYLPDRRDLNRSFPGHERGSLASRMANLLMAEVVSKCTHGIDLHTGAIHRTNLPQIRADLSDPETEDMARAFGAPVILDAKLRDGSLREAARTKGVRMLLYEAGEALRFDEISIRSGVQGILNVMRKLGMLPSRATKRKPREPYVAHSTSWTRAPESGILRRHAELGTRVETGAVLGEIVDPFNGGSVPLPAPFAGVVIGLTKLPLVHEGDALFHIGRFEDSAEVAGGVEDFRMEHQPDDTGLADPVEPAP